jgi:acyl dehydratase
LPDAAERTSEAAAETTTVAVGDLPSLAGRELGPSRWVQIGQKDIDAFADLTGDRQWIHIDPDRAKQGPFGATLVHGFLTLSHSTALLYELIDVQGASQILNYGLNRVRFVSPNPVDGRVRMTVRIADVSPVPGGYQVTFGLTFDREGGDRPVCVAELLFRYYDPESA